MGFNKKVSNFVNNWLKLSLVAFCVSIIGALLIGITIPINKLYTSFYGNVLLFLMIVFCIAALSLLITVPLKIIIYFENRNMKDYLPEQLPEIKPMSSTIQEKQTIKTTTQYETINMTNVIILCAVIIIAGIIMFIYGDMMGSKYLWSSSYAKFANNDIAIYAILRILGILAIIGGVLGIIITPLVNKTR